MTNLSEGMTLEEQEWQVKRVDDSFLTDRPKSVKKNTNKSIMNLLVFANIRVL